MISTPFPICLPAYNLKSDIPCKELVVCGERCTVVAKVLLLCPSFGFRSKNELLQVDRDTWLSSKMSVYCLLGHPP